MNEEYSHLIATGDEATEARIIAWVLGEASAFEAAELESLCAANPEWRVFHRRMLALHDCLKEAHGPVAGDEWKLSMDQRGRLDDLIGKRETLASRREKTRRPWWIHVAGIAAVLMLLALIGSLATGVFRSRGMARMEMKETPVIASYLAEMPADESVESAVASDNGVVEGESGNMALFRTLEAAKPSAPSSSSSQTIAAATTAPSAIPVPTVDGKEPTVAFGTGDEFGEGWGGQAGGAVMGGLQRDVAKAAAANAPITDRSKESVTFNGRYESTDQAGKDAQNFYFSRNLEEAQPELAQEDRKNVSEEMALLGLDQEPATKPGSVASSDASALAPREVSRSQAMPALPNATGATAVAKTKPTDDPFLTGEDLASGEKGKKGDDVGGILKKGEAFAELGRYDDAVREYENALRVDPDNRAARRSLERVAAAKSDYYRAAYDHTRAELLKDVDKAWDLAIPAEGGESEGKRETDREARLREDAMMAGKANLRLSGVADATDALAKVSEKGLAEREEQILEKNEMKALQDMDGQKAAAPAPAEVAPKPQASAPPVSREISTSEEPYSTFSLRVSDNSFRIAQAAMSQNQRPPAESVRVEEFYNAFDYGDPIPTADEPVTAAMEQSAHPVLPQRNLLRIALRTASSGRAAGQPLRLTLLVDQSGSMNRNDRRAAMLASVQELCRMLQEQDQVSVIGFSRTPRLLAEKIPGNQTQRLLEIIRAVPSDGGTNLEEALKLAEVVARRNQLPQAQNRLLLMTDGAANLGNADPARLSEWVKQLRQKNLSFDIAGIGTDGLNDPLLVEIARHGNGRYYVMNDAAQAKQQFASQLAGAFRPVAENVKVQVRFNPLRVSRYQLIGFEKDRLRTEDFRNDKVDAAEMAAAEAGQALYQIELLPEGTGDIGEVSVRFRDVATGQMVERKWTIRHDASTPVFDRATPTMQLAGLAMLSAGKLQGGDFASMIRFSEMQEPRRNVRETFSQSRRVAELLQMIDQLQD